MLLDREFDTTTKKLAMFEKKIGQKTGKSYSPPDRIHDRKSSGRGRISREGALDLFESRERRDNIFAETTENAKKLDQKQQISMGNFFFGRGKTNFCGGDITSNWLASDHPGAYASIPHPSFGAKDVCYSRIQLAPHARRRDVPMIVSERMPASCTDDEVANSGRTEITIVYTDDMLSRERTIDCIMHYSLGDNTIY